MISWLFEIDTLKLSTQDVTYGGSAYSGVILADSFSGVTMRWDISGSNIIQPNEVEFSISNVAGTYSAANIDGEYCTVRLVIDGVQSRAWKFKIASAVEYYKVIVCQCEDFLQDVLDGDYPNTKTPRSIWPSTSGEDTEDYCIPVIFGTAYIPIRPVNTGTDVYYVLGSAGTYTVSEVQSPREWPSSSTWASPEYTMQKSTSGGYSLLQPLINDGGNGVWSYSGTLLDMLCKYSNAATLGMTNPAEWIEYILEDIGVQSADIDSITFSAAETIYDTEVLSFNGGFYEKSSREEILSNLLALCDSYLTCSDKVELRQFSDASQETFTKVRLQSFKIGSVARHAHNTGNVSWPESGKPQDVLTGATTVPIDSSITDESVSSESLEAWPLAGQSQNAQRAAQLYFQKRFGQKYTVSFDSTFTILNNKNLVPGMVITVNNSLYGGNYKAILTELTINKDLSIKCEGVVLEYMDSWSDITPAVITPVTDSVESFSLLDAINESVTRTVEPATGITTTSMPYEIFLTFEYTKNDYFDALELWMSDDNDRSNATLIADIVGDTFSITDTIIGDTKYFWVRIRDSYGNVSDWYPESETGGVAGSTSSDPEAYLALLSGSLTESELYSDLNSRIDLIDTEFTWVNDIFEEETWAGLVGLFPDVMGYSQTIRDDLDNNISITTALKTNVEDNYASITYVDQVESDIYGSSVSSFTQINSAFNTVNSTLNTKASITYVDQTESDIYAASVGSFTNINAEFSDVYSDIATKATITYVDNTKSTIYGSSVSSFTQINSAFNTVNSTLNTKASITYVDQTESDIYGASVSTFTNINSAFNTVNSSLDAKASLTYVNSTFTTAANAQAIASAQIEAEVEGNYASITEFNEVVSDVETAQAQRTIKIDANDHIVGMQMIAGGTGPDTSTFIIHADTFKVVSSSSSTTLNTPFVIGNINGVSSVGMNGNVIVDGTILADAINVNNLFAETLVVNSGGLIKSNNYSAGSAGWQIDSLGNAEFNDVTVRGTLAGVDINSVDGLIVDSAEGIQVAQDASIYFKSYTTGGFLLKPFYSGSLNSLALIPDAANHRLFIGLSNDEFNEVQFYVDDTFDIIFPGSVFIRFTSTELRVPAINFGGSILDDYENGTYTPTLTPGFGSISLNSSYNTLAYTVVGRQVTVTGEIKISSVSSPSGTLALSLPFTPGALTENAEYFAGSASYNGIAAGLTDCHSMIMYGFTSGALYLGFQGNQNRNMVTVASGMQAGASLNFGFSYFKS